MLRIDHPLILPLVPVPVRDQVLLLWRLDARLCELAHAGKEPALRMIRLRWWADRLAALDNGPPPEPLLEAVHDTLLEPCGASALAGLAEEWFAFAESEGASTLPGETLFVMTSQLIDGRRPGGPAAAAALWQQVALLEPHGEAADWRRIAARARSVSIGGWPRALAALAGLARAIALRQGRRSEGREQLLLLRIGLIGR